MPEFTFKKVSNMVLCVSDCDIVFYSWNQEEFTRRKLLNTIARLKACYNNNVCFYFDGVSDWI